MHRSIGQARGMTLLEVLISSFILTGIVVTAILLVSWGTTMYGQDTAQVIAERNIQGALEQLSADLKETKPSSVKVAKGPAPTGSDDNTFVMMYSARNATGRFVMAESGAPLSDTPAWQGVVAYLVALPDEDEDGVEDPGSVGPLYRYEHTFGTPKTFVVSLTLPTITRLDNGTLGLDDDVYRIDIGDGTTFVHFKRDGTPYAPLATGDTQRVRQIIGQYQRLALDPEKSPFVVSLVGWWSAEKGTGAAQEKAEGRLVAKHILCRSKN